MKNNVKVIEMEFFSAFGIIDINDTMLGSCQFKIAFQTVSKYSSITFSLLLKFYDVLTVIIKSSSNYQIQQSLILHITPPAYLHVSMKAGKGINL